MTAPAERPVRARGLLALAAYVAAALGATSAFAIVGAGDDRTAATKQIAELQAVPAHSALAKEPLQRAAHALRRASDARAAGDHPHAALLEALGREWAETAHDLVRAAESEKKLIDLQTKTSDLETKAVRGRALYEQTLARRGRAQEKLDEIERAIHPIPSGSGKPSSSKAPAASKAAASEQATSPAPSAAKPSPTPPASSAAKPQSTAPASSTAAPAAPASSGGTPKSAPATGAKKP